MRESPEPTDPERQRINQLVNEIVSLPKAFPEPVDYFREFLTRVLTAVAAPIGGAYLLNPGRGLKLLYQINFPQLGLADDHVQEAHSELLLYACQIGRPLMVRPREQVADTENDQPAAINPTDYFIFLVPIKVNDKIAGLVEVVQTPDRAHNSQWGLFQFITKMTKLASAYVQEAQKQKNKPRRTTLQRFARGLVALLAGLLAAWLCRNSAEVKIYQQSYRWGTVAHTQGFTQSRLERIDQALSQYQEKFKAPPKSLQELQAVDDFFKGKPEETLQDGWGRPFLYTTDGVTCLVTSYGRDGLPGGEGLDSDLTNQIIRPREADSTFSQYWKEARPPLPMGVIHACLLTGVATCALSYISIPIGKMTFANTSLAVSRIVVILIGAILISEMMLAFHLSGH